MRRGIEGLTLCGRRTGRAVRGLWSFLSWSAQVAVVLPVPGGIFGLPATLRAGPVRWKYCSGQTCYASCGRKCSLLLSQARLLAPCRGRLSAENHGKCRPRTSVRRGSIRWSIGCICNRHQPTVALRANQFPESRHAGRGCPRLAEITYSLTITME